MVEADIGDDADRRMRKPCFERTDGLGLNRHALRDERLRPVFMGFAHKPPVFHD
jgi:hypothetical protein